MLQYKILIAEENQEILDTLALHLTGEGFKVVPVTDLQETLHLVKENTFSVMVLDILSKKLNTYELLQQIRSFSTIPILALSDNNSSSNKILSLSVGADICLNKPLNPLEIVAYIKSILRRCYKFDSKVESNDTKKITLGDLELDTQKYVLKKRGNIVPLTSTELKIVVKMMKNPERVFTKAQLYECVNGKYFENDDNTMMVHISNIRSKIEDNPSKPQYIVTVRGLGYRIENKHKD